MAPTPVIYTDRVALLLGDCVETPLPKNSVDAICCDPPAGISFMGADWDSDKGGRDLWIDWFRGAIASGFSALKPGGYALVWAHPKTSHWTATALENAGFVINTRVSHLFLTGMPKGIRVHLPDGERCTRLKEAMEDWWLVQKPREGTFEKNHAKWGTGYLNLGACRIDAPGGGQSCKYHKRGEDCRGHDATRSLSGVTNHGKAPSSRAGEESADRRYTEEGSTDFAKTPGPRGGDPLGKWPAQLIVGEGVEPGFEPALYFYAPKPSRSERDTGCDHLEEKTGGEATGRKDGSKGTKNPRAGAGRTGGAKNFHPTVKSIDLMRWLIRLITPPGGIVLDPFTGSGSTGVAALAEGMDFIGVEMSEEYIQIAKARLEHALGES